MDASPRTPPMTTTLSFVVLEAPPPPPPYPHDTSYSLTIRPHPVRPNIDHPFSGSRSEPSRIVRSTVPPRSLGTDFRSIADSTDGDDAFLFLPDRDATIFADQGSEQNSSEDNFDAITDADQGSEHYGILRRGISSCAAGHRHSLLDSRMVTHQRKEHNHGHDQQTRGSKAPMLLGIFSPCPTCHHDDYDDVQQDHGFRLMPRTYPYQDQEEKGAIQFL
jgi:hypothetical protein